MKYLRFRRQGNRKLVIGGVYFVALEHLETVHLPLCFEIPCEVMTDKICPLLSMAVAVNTTVNTAMS
jgi:hypothetical protein